MSKLLNDPYEFGDINYDKYSMDILKDVAKKKKITGKFSKKKEIIKLLKTVDKMPQLEVISKKDKQLCTWKYYEAQKEGGGVILWNWSRNIPKFSELTPTQQSNIVWMSAEVIFPTSPDKCRHVRNVKSWWNDIVTNGLLSDSVINCLLHLLKKKYGINGCYKTVEVSSKNNFGCKMFTQGMQVIHCGVNHWILCENIFKNVYNVWDGLNVYNNDVKFQLCKVK